MRCCDTLAEAVHVRDVRARVAWLLSLMVVHRLHLPDVHVPDRACA
jgi:hypothetical protein